VKIGRGLAHGLVDRRVEITGPVAPRKKVINALNSNATQYMADFEDSLAPPFKAGRRNYKRRAFLVR